jgi:hypothetical protein
MSQDSFQVKVVLVTKSVNALRYEESGEAVKEVSECEEEESTKVSFCISPIANSKKLALRVRPSFLPSF